MSKVIEALSEAECELLAILTDFSGIDQGEFAIHDLDTDDGCWRAWDFQYYWWRSDQTRQIDMAGRSIGKSLGIVRRCCVVPFVIPGQEMTIVAPQLIHLEALVTLIVYGLLNTRLFREMLKPSRSNGIVRRPFQVEFVNGARLYGRIPQRNGLGFKGVHPVLLETDEGQDIPDEAYDELIETLRRAHSSSRWRVHGVTKGVRGKFWEFTKPENGWRIHQLTAIHRPNWTDEERQEKIAMYGSEHDPSYRRNIMGLHGDAQIALFVLHRLMACVDDEEDSDYNQLVYYQKRITDEMLTDSGLPIEMLVDLPGTHRGFESYWAGMDIGFTRDPSELLVFGQEAETVKGKREQRLRLLLRLHLKRIKAGDQMRLIKHICNWYQPKVFAMDANGVGYPIFQLLQEEADKGDTEARRSLGAIKGYNFGEKILVDWDRTKAEETGAEVEDKDVQIMANVKEISTDRLRDYVDQKKVVLPWDRDLISEFEGQTYSMTISTDQYGRRRFSGGKDHTLDAARMAVLAHSQWFLDEMLRMRAARTDAPVLDMAVQY